MEAGRDTIIPGLTYIPVYLAPEAQHALLATIDAQPWREELRRRVQHYGYRYDYKARRADPSMLLGPLPPWLAVLADALHAAGYFATPPDQAIVNEYLPGQGISRHVDCVPCFGPTVASLSLGSACVMDLLDPRADVVVPVALAPGGLLVLREDARYVWQHRIAARKSDTHAGVRWERGRRVSVTFRTVLARTS